MSNDPTNEERADRIDKTLEFYAIECKGDGWVEVDDITDLLADIMHYCKHEGEDFEEFLQTARMNFEAETEG